MKTLLTLIKQVEEYNRLAEQFGKKTMLINIDNELKALTKKTLISQASETYNESDVLLNTELAKLDNDHYTATWTCYGYTSTTNIYIEEI